MYVCVSGGTARKGEKTSLPAARLDQHGLAGIGGYAAGWDLAVSAQRGGGDCGEWVEGGVFGVVSRVTG